MEAFQSKASSLHLSNLQVSQRQPPSYEPDFNSASRKTPFSLSVTTTHSKSPESARYSHSPKANNSVQVQHFSPLEHTENHRTMSDVDSEHSTSTSSLIERAQAADREYSDTKETIRQLSTKLKNTFIQSPHIN